MLSPKIPPYELAHRSCLSPGPPQPFRWVLWDRSDLVACYDDIAETDRHLKRCKMIEAVTVLEN